MIIDIHRLIATDYGTLGVMSIDTIPQFTTLEPPWAYNERAKSSIPVGVYDAKKTTSAKYGETLLITGVPERSGILFHSGNYPEHTKGCILIGTGYLNNDDDYMITNSREAMRRFRQIFNKAEKIKVNIDMRSLVG